MKDSIELNEPLRTRLRACLNQLVAAYAGGGPMSSASKGMEREVFVEVFLKNIMPPAYRFGTGDVIGVDGLRSGQIDVVVENLTFPSFPMVGAAIPRLYLAEGVGAAIEVKSNLEKQWADVARTASALSSVKRTPPLYPFAVGYVGWRSLQRMIDYVHKMQVLGCLTLDPPRYVGAATRRVTPASPKDQPITLPENQTYTFLLEDELALWGFITQLHWQITHSLWSDAMGNYQSLTPIDEKLSKSKL